jgi:DNA-binding IclR family transcriptional regulator
MRLRGPNAASTQSVSRALAILGQFESGQPRRRVSEVARELGVSASTASRLLFSLQREGFVEYDPHTGQYGLGLELVTLASRALNGNELYRVAVGDLAAAADEFDMTVNLSIMRRDQLFYLAVVEPPASMTPISLIGERGSLHSTAMGAILLAGLPPDEREEVMARIPYPRFTPNTVSSPSELRAKVALVAERGYAIDREEGALGRGCVATGIRAASGSVVAACSLNGPMTVMDLDRRASQLGARMIEIAEQISRKLGYRMGSGTGIAGARVRTGSGTGR